MVVQHTSSPAGQTRDSAGSNDSGATPEPPSLRADIAALAAEIEAAHQGSTALDARIHFGFRVAARRAPDFAALLIDEGITWPTVEAVVAERIPAYSSSLDAALEGEDISFVIRSAKRQRWGAMQKARCGTEVLAWAATEPLARRLSAIRAWQADLEDAAERSGNASTRVPDNGGEEEQAAGEDDWEVVF